MHVIRFHRSSDQFERLKKKKKKKTRKKKEPRPKEQTKDEKKHSADNLPPSQRLSNPLASLLKDKILILKHTGSDWQIMTNLLCGKRC